MAVDYDLVVIGGSPAGVYAAVAASNLRARVALVEPEPVALDWGLGMRYWGYPSPVGTHFVGDRPVNPIPGYEWAAGVAATLAESDSPPVLASLGIDAIAGSGVFSRLPHLALEVGSRRLRSRTYLLATGSRPAVPDIDGLVATGYLTNEAIVKLPGEQLPESWIVLGDSPAGIELAIALSRLGKRVTLVVASPHILTKEDPEAALLVQANVEAEGVRVLTGSKVTKVGQIQGKKWVQAGERAIYADEILLATGYQPNVESLNLETVGVKWHGLGIQLNEKLQTTNPRIYGCGNVAGGYVFAHVANYEASIAVKNALFLPIFKVDYRALPWAIFTEPNLARVGLTEQQARGRYGHDIIVLRQYFKSVAVAQVRGDTTGFCKIIVRRNGEIVGAHIVGAEASELIHSIALAMQNKLKVGAIASLSHIWPTLSEINGQTARLWNQQRTARWQNFLEGWFNWRRS